MRGVRKHIMALCQYQVGAYAWESKGPYFV